MTCATCFGTGVACPQRGPMLDERGALRTVPCHCVLLAEATEGCGGDTKAGGQHYLELLKRYDYYWKNA